MKRLTKKKVEKYLKGGSGCPKCGNTDIEGEGLDIEGGKAYQDLSCVCGFGWTDEYTLTGIIPREDEE